MLARYGLYDDAIQQFQAALQAKPGSDDVSFDLANAYFRKGLYSDALDAAMQVSDEGRKDDSYLALLGDIYAHQGDSARAEEIYHSAINRNPDNDQDYLSLALLEFRENNVAAAKQTLLKGQVAHPWIGEDYLGIGIGFCIGRRHYGGSPAVGARRGDAAGMARKLFDAGSLLLSNRADRQSQRGVGPVQEQQRTRWAGRKPD